MWANHVATLWRYKLSLFWAAIQLLSDEIITVSSAYVIIVSLSMSVSKSFMYNIKSNGPRIVPWVTRVIMFWYSLLWFFIITFCFLFERLLAKSLCALPSDAKRWRIWRILLQLRLAVTRISNFWPFVKPCSGLLRSCYHMCCCQPKLQKILHLLASLALPLIPYLYNFARRISWLTVLKALAKSKKIAITLLSRLLYIKLQKKFNTTEIPLFFMKPNCYEDIILFLLMKSYNLL